MDASAGDLDGDGAQKELLFPASITNTGGAVWPSSNPAGSAGGSPSTRDRTGATAIGDGGQSAYILFPKTDVHRALKQEGNPVNHFWIRDGDGLTAMTTDTEIYFDLDRTLVCHNVTPSNTYRNLLENLSQKGLDLPAPDRDFQEEAKLLAALLLEEADAGTTRPWPRPSPRRSIPPGDPRGLLSPPQGEPPWACASGR